MTIGHAQSEDHVDDEETLAHILAKRDEFGFKVSFPTHVYARASDHPKLGLCLFEPGADVDIVFDYDPQGGTVTARNQTG